MGDTSAQDNTGARRKEPATKQNYRLKRDPSQQRQLPHFDVGDSRSKGNEQTSQARRGNQGEQPETRRYRARSVSSNRGHRGRGEFGAQEVDQCDDRGRTRGRSRNRSQPWSAQNDHQWDGRRGGGRQRSQSRTGRGAGDRDYDDEHDNPYDTPERDTVFNRRYHDPVLQESARQLTRSESHSRPPFTPNLESDSRGHRSDAHIPLREALTMSADQLIDSIPENRHQSNPFLLASGSWGLDLKQSRTAADNRSKGISGIQSCPVFNSQSFCNMGTLHHMTHSYKTKASQDVRKTLVGVLMSLDLIVAQQITMSVDINRIMRELKITRNDTPIGLASTKRVPPKNRDDVASLWNSSGTGSQRFAPQSGKFPNLTREHYRMTLRKTADGRAGGHYGRMGQDNDEGGYEDDDDANPDVADRV